jgi:ADP-ribose pyrophosphatase YjhB (NUDIX family)
MQKMQKTLTCVDSSGNKHEVPVEKLSWLPGCYAIVLHDGKILLSHQHGKYVLPGGSGEFGEMPEDTAVRETFEETGIRVNNPRPLDVKSNLFIMPGIDKPVQSIQLFYACDYVGGELSIAGLDEHEQRWTDAMPEWVPLDKLDSIKAGSSFEWRDVVKLAAKGSRN